MRERVLLQVVRLDELHAALAADVRPDVFVLHHVVLKLARVLEGLLALGTPAGTQGHSVTEPNGELKKAEVADPDERDDHCQETNVDVGKEMIKMEQFLMQPDSNVRPSWGIWCSVDGIIAVNTSFQKRPPAGE